MTIHKFFRLCSLTVASLFWASCGTDSNPQFPVAGATNPDSSADAGEGRFSSASSEIESSESAEPASSSSVAELSSSAESLEPSSSADIMPASSSETPASSSSGIFNSSTIPTYVLARDSSVTCETFGVAVPICSKDYDCNDLTNFLKQKQSVSEKLLTFWEKELESCGAIQLQNAALYGIGPCASTRIKHKMKCSNDSTYEDFRIDEKLAYTSEKEYNEAKGIVPDDLVESCPQEDFALFPDILADVQKELYKRIDDDLEKNDSLSDAQRTYLESLLDRTNKTFKEKFAPYCFECRSVVEYTNLNYESKNWFNGYIAKTKICADGTSEITKRYQEKYDAILAECLEIIENNAKAAAADK